LQNNIDPVERERQLDVNRAIAQKIRNRLQQLENATDNDKKRWVWELLQNAKDTVSNEKPVDIDITLTNDYVEFTHNGGLFTPRNITNLVHQISSKEGTESVGRFGTGFLTTHTLSRLVEVESIYQDDETNEHYSFSISLDREGNDEQELIAGIAKTWDSYTFNKIEKLTERCTTKFRYIKPDINVALGTLEDFESSILLNLAFVSGLGKITVNNKIDKYMHSFEFKEKVELSDCIFVSKFILTINSTEKEIYLLQASNNNLDIAIEVNYQDGQYIFQPIKENIPRLFCSFPLIGTEDFYFPFIINSQKFSPKTERDRLYLNGDGKLAEENKDLLKEATELYSRVVSYSSENKLGNIFIISEHKLPPANDDFDQLWYKKEIQLRLREILLSYPIVETENKQLLKIKDSDGKAGVYFPYSKNEIIRETIWEKTFSLEPNLIPCKSSIGHWYKIAKNWNDCSYQKIEDLVFDIDNIGSINKLSEKLKLTTSESLNWLSEVCEFIQKEDETLFEKYSIIPNQYGDFQLKDDLYIDKNIPSKLKDILRIINIDIRESLLHKEVSIFDKNFKSKNSSFVLEKINNNISKTYNVKFINGIYSGSNGEEYTQEEFDKLEQIAKKLSFTLLGYTVTDINADHKVLWEFARTVFFDEVPNKIEKIDNIKNINLHKECFIWVIKSIASYVSELGDCEKLESELHGSINAVGWLNKLVEYIQYNEEYRNLIDFNKYKILPNQHGLLCKKEVLFLDDELDIKLKKVLEFINPKWIGELLDTKIFLKLPDSRVRKFEDISKEIDNSFRTHTGNRQSPEFIKSLRILLSWFKNTSDKKIKENFDWVYNNKAELSLSILGDDNEKDEIFKIIESGKAPLLAKIANSTLTDDDLKELSENSEEYKEYLELKRSGKSTLEDQDFLNKIFEVTGETYSSVDEYKKKAKGEVIEIITEPTLGGTKDVDFDAINQSNTEAKKIIKRHLSNKEDYDISGWHETSKTIISGVKKKGISIALVIKGANTGTIYFDKAGKEKRALKNSFSELWVNNNGNIIHETLGKLIEDHNLTSIKTN
jgi:hypothetical protein